MRALLAGVCAVVVVAACGRAGGPVVAGGDRLYTAASTQDANFVSVIDSRSHSVVRSLPWGTLSPDWAHLYSVRSGSLVDVDPQTGATLHTLQLPGQFELPPATIGGLPGGLSQNGRWLVTEALDAKSGSLASASHLAVVDTTYVDPVKRINLPGDFEFDAISNDGQRIYLIEYVTSSQYRVRFLNVATAQLDPTIVFDKSDGSTAMAGLRLSGVASPDGHWLYSVYAREDKGAFIHMLSLDGPLAFCIDLPGSGYATDQNAFHWSLSLSADGSHLYASNGAMGVVVEVNPNTDGVPTIRRTAHVNVSSPSTGWIAQDVQAKEFGASGSVLSPDGQTLVITGSPGLAWLDTASLSVSGRQLSTWTIWSLALSPNAETLYAVSDGGMIAAVSMASPHTTTTFAGGPGQPIALIRVEGAQAP